MSSPRARPRLSLQARALAGSVPAPRPPGPRRRFCRRARRSACAQSERPQRGASACAAGTPVGTPAAPAAAAVSPPLPFHRGVGARGGELRTDTPTPHPRDAPVAPSSRGSLSRPWAHPVRRSASRSRRARAEHLAKTPDERSTTTGAPKSVRSQRSGEAASPTGGGRGITLVKRDSRICR